jgi:sulfatase maturation enzyme AslB (radical SAM superfamily)
MEDQSLQNVQRQKLAAKALPSMVLIELTNTCNLRCAKCTLVNTSRKRGFIDDALVKKVLGDVESSGASTEIAFSGSGEPTLHPRLVEFVRAARSVSNVGVIGFATNGVELHPDLSERLLDAGLTRLKASLDTDDAVEYRRLNGRDAYEQVKTNFLRFCEINKATGNRCRVTLKATLYENDLSLARRIKEQWEPYVAQVRVTPVHNWAGLEKRGLDTTAPRSPCRMLWQQVQVLWDGQITLCCMDSMEGRFNMGDAREQNLSSYWLHDPELKRIRRCHEALDLRDLPECAKCDMWAYFDIEV